MRSSAAVPNNGSEPWHRIVLFGLLLRRRVVAVWILLVAVVQLTLSWRHWPALGCPFREVTGIPCPGCGLTAALRELLSGHWRESLQTHLFAPLFLAALALIVFAAAAPSAWRDRLTAAVVRCEQRTGVTAWLGAALIAYWLLREA